MELSELKQFIIQKNIPKLLIFFGEERKLIEYYIDEIANVQKLEKIKYENINQLFNTFSSKNILKTKKALNIVSIESLSKIDKQISMLANLNENIIIMVDNIDKRSSLYKSNVDYIIEFSKLSVDLIKALLKTKLRVDDNLIDWLIETCNGSYDRCLLEADKLLIFNSDNYNQLMKQLIADGSIYREIPDNVFDFSNAVVGRDKIKAFKVYEDVKKSSHNAISLLSILYNSFKNIMLVQLSSNPTEKSTGLPEKQINALRYRINKYSGRELINILGLILKLDLDLKQGNIEENLIIDYLLTKVM